MDVYLRKRKKLDKQKKLGKQNKMHMILTGYGRKYSYYGVLFKKYVEN